MLQYILLKYKLLIIVFFIINYVFAQNNSYQLNIINCSEQYKHDKIISYQKNHSDSLSLVSYLDNYLQLYFKKGFLSASFDSIIYNNTNINAYLYFGQKYSWVNVSFDSIDDIIVRKTRIEKRKYSYQSINFSDIKKTNSRILEYCENNGYPFATITLEPLSFHNNKIEANLQLNKNEYYVFDSIHIIGNTKTSVTYIKKYLGIEKDKEYNEEKIKNISTRINELPFIRETKPYEIEFKKGKTDIKLYLENKKANRFNGIIGFLPDNETQNKILLTGELSLYLLNSFKKGELVSFTWKRTKVLSQDLTLNINYPYLFSTQFGVDFQLNIDKVDTLFLSVNSTIGLQYLINSRNYIAGYSDFYNSTLLSNEMSQNGNELYNADIKSQLLGLGFRFEKLDYKINPRNGYFLEFKISNGIKRIIKNPDIDEDIYNDFDTKTNQSKGTLIFFLYKTIFKNTVIKYQNNSGFINNSNLFENELFKLGGLKTIRGFDEKSILASLFYINTLELRYIYEKNSNVYLFFDQCFYKKNIHAEKKSDEPLSFGIGINLETKAGIFTINYAVGKQMNNPFLLKSAKIHFGYLNYF
ncbi:MAG: BamA/TamA family outer membrane protein [Bacteroidales bacterium]|nr:BamA/TamA family outer membrane protein [Bacteroidales bacterium]